jgi:hypothetical protein
MPPLSCTNGHTKHVNRKEVAVNGQSIRDSFFIRYSTFLDRRLPGRMEDEAGDFPIRRLVERVDAEDPWEGKLSVLVLAIGRFSHAQSAIWTKERAERRSNGPRWLWSKTINRFC